MSTPIHHMTTRPVLDRNSHDDIHLRIVATTDVHMQIRPYDYFRDAPDDRGLALAASTIADLRDGFANTLLFDNGDFLQGNPMADVFGEGVENSQDIPNPAIAAMNALGYDASTLGNHDFDYGLPFLKKAIAQANFPIVSANLRTTPEVIDGNGHLTEPWVLLERDMQNGAGHRQLVRIGVIGFAPPQTTLWDKAALGGQLTSDDIVLSAQKHVEAMKQAGADLIIALAHSGIENDMHVPGQENAAAPLASLAGIDAVIAGHTHLVFPGPDHSPSLCVDPVAGTLHEKPAVMPGSKASHLGVIDLHLTRQGSGWGVKDTRSSAMPVPNVAQETPAFQAVMDATRHAHELTLAHIRRPVGATTVPLQSYFSAIEPASSVLLIAEAQRWYAQSILAGTAMADIPLLSAAAPFKCGGRGGPGHYADVPTGPVQAKHVADLYMFPNQFTLLKITGEDLRNWLEFSAGQYRQVTPGQADQALIDPAFPGHDADTILGATYQIDLSSPARFHVDGTFHDASAMRVRELRHQGNLVKDEDAFLVATNTYRASGDGGYPGARNGSVALQTAYRNRDILSDYLKCIGTIRELPTANWQLSHIKGASVLFETGPGAARYVAGKNLTCLGETSTGFMQYRLIL